MKENQPKEPSIFDSLTHQEHRASLVGLMILVSLVLKSVVTIAKGIDLLELADNLALELFGAGLTFWIFDRFTEHRDKSQRKKELIVQMGSTNNVVATEAVRLLRLERWLTDGSLKRAFLYGSSLQQTPLWEAKLEGVNLMYANLEEANLDSVYLSEAILQGANLHLARLSNADLIAANFQSANMMEICLLEADMRGASLVEANLTGADLRDANLQYAELLGAHLQGANLHQANLQGASLLETNFDSQTILPDGENWTPETDIARFTDQGHGDFWRPKPDINGRYPQWYKTDSD